MKFKISPSIYMLILCLSILTAAISSHAQTFSATSNNMSIPEVWHTATTLSNGTVLIAGGFSGPSQNATTTAEVYTPYTTNQFTSTGSMITARGGDTATLLGTGQVLVTGGRSNETSDFTVYSTAELYNPTTGVFATVNGAMQQTRTEQTATLLQDGTGDVLIVGGLAQNGSADATADLYNPSTGSFTPAGSLNTARYGQTATLLADGTILITGGKDTNGNVISSAELYNPGTRQFATLPSMVSGRYGHTASRLNDLTVLITGGVYSSNGDGSNSAEIYNPTTQSFKQVGNMTTTRVHHTASVLSDGTVLLAGGLLCINWGGPHGQCTATSTAEIYSPGTTSFAATGSMSEQLSSQTATVLQPGQVLIAGGATSIATAELFIYQSYVGYINPKYIVVGVTYAPPGPASYVQYTDTTGISTTNTLMNTFSQGYTVSISEQADISAWVNGSVTASSSTGYTQTSSNTSAITVAATSAETYKTTGTGNAFAPVDHDYDIIWLWLNPELILTLNPNTPNTILWNGYGYSPQDNGKGLDVYGVAVGQLNGDLPIDPSEAAILARSWAANQIYGAGDGPGLNANDFANILTYDPFSNVNYQITGTGETTTDGRFTYAQIVGQQGGAPIFDYEQALPGAMPGTQSLMNTNTNTSTQTQAATQATNQTFSLDESFGGSLFGVTLKTDLKQSSSFTWTTAETTATTDSTAIADTLFISGPPCIGSFCDPSYAGPGEFTIYQDNLYGTFLCAPVWSVATQTTTTTLAATPNPGFANSTVTLTATIVNSDTNTAPGSVKFYSGSTLLGSANVNISVSGASTATFTASTAGLTPGVYPATAVYSGYSSSQNNTAASTSAPVYITLNPGTATTMTANPNPVKQGNNVVLTATVVPSGGSTTPTGTVSFQDGSLIVGTAPLNASGVATLTVSTTSYTSGTYPIDAVYEGTSTFGASTSPVVAVVVQ